MIDKFENFIFDLDGTIADTAHDIIDSLKEAFINAGCFSKSIENKLNVSLIGPPIREIIKNINVDLDQEVIESIVANYRNIYDNNKYHHTVCYDGIADLLYCLKQNSKKLFIATNKPQKPSLRILEILGMKDYFSEIVCIDSITAVSSKHKMVEYIITRWKLDTEKTIMIGDSESDITAAKKNSIKCIAILSGYGKPESIRCECPDHVIEQHCQLKNLLKV